MAPPRYEKRRPSPATPFCKMGEADPAGVGRIKGSPVVVIKVRALVWRNAFGAKRVRHRRRWQPPEGLFFLRDTHKTKAQPAHTTRLPKRGTPTLIWIGAWPGLGGHGCVVRNLKAGLP